MSDEDLLREMLADYGWVLQLIRERDGLTWGELGERLGMDVEKVLKEQREVL